MSSEIVRAHRTEVGLLLLSLDCVAVHFVRIGLVFHQPQEVVRAARACIEHNASRERPRSDDAPDTIIGDLTATLARAGNAADALAVGSFLRRRPATDVVGWLLFCWGGVLLRYSAAYDAALRGLGLRPDAVALLGAQARTYTNWHDAVEEIEAEIEASFGSEWDHVQVRQYQGDLGTGTPISPLLGWLRAESFLAVMASLLRGLTDNELGIFEAWAKAVASVELRLLESQLTLAAVQRALRDYPPLATDTVPALWATQVPTRPALS